MVDDSDGVAALSASPFGRHAVSYRAREMAQLAAWLRRGASGAVVGGGGSGKSNLLGFLCQRPDALAAYLPPDGGPVVAVLIDLNDLPAGGTATLYRVLLRGFDEAGPRLPPAIAQLAGQLLQEYLAVTDPFVTQTALRRLLAACAADGLRVALVLDRFDKLAAAASPTLMDSLRALRDAFKDTLVYVVGMRHEIAYLADPTVLGELYEVLDSAVCWVGPLSEADARAVIAQETAGAVPGPSAAEVAQLWALTGGHPALLKAACAWWLAQGAATPADDWCAALLAEPRITFRLGELWDGLTQAEQLALAEAARLTLRRAAGAQRVTDPAALAKAAERARQELEDRHAAALARLAARGYLRPTADGWQVFSQLLAGRLATDLPSGRGRITRQPDSGALWQGTTLLDPMPNLERRLLDYLLDHARARLAKSDLIEGVWPDEALEAGVMDDTLYQVVKSLRRRIEPDAARPRYLVTWRGRPEGGYQFFPEGSPVVQGRASAHPG